MKAASDAEPLLTPREAGVENQTLLSDIRLFWLAVGEAAILIGGIVGFINVRRRFGEDARLRQLMSIGTVMIMILYATALLVAPP